MKALLQLATFEHLYIYLKQSKIHYLAESMFKRPKERDSESTFEN